MFLWALLFISTTFNVLSYRPQLVRNKIKKIDNLENVFVQRWAWFHICDYAYANHTDGGGPFTNATPFDPEEVEAGSIIFSTAYGIEKFLEEVHPRIKNPYILVTIYYGPVFGIRKYVEDPKIIAWFGMANREAIIYDKFTIIPIGVLRDEGIFERRLQENEIFKQLRAQPKQDMLYVNFTVHEGRYDGRGDIYNFFKDKPFSKLGKPKGASQLPFSRYMQDMAQCKFTLSPEGDMHDCYRHWEALLVGSIPVVHRSPLDQVFEELPVVIVDDYKEVTEEFLQQKYEEMKNKQYNMRKLYMQYWVDKINDAKAKFFASQRA